jgi:hypothetical protein
MFRRSRFADISLNQWLALTPPKLVQAHLNLDDATTTAVTAHKGKPIIVKWVSDLGTTLATLALRLGPALGGAPAVPPQSAADPLIAAEKCHRAW